MKNAFILIELLVVITIIVVLLALLVPALDQTIYQAELATCAAKQKAITTALAVYASQYKRSYPDRPSYLDSERSYYIGRVNRDDRPLFQQKMGMSLENLICPLDDGGIDFSLEANGGGTGVSVWLFANYDLWFGWSWTGEKAMKRLGDGFTYGGTRFDLLVSDHEGMFGNANGFLTTHPDRDGGLSQVVVQNEPVPISGDVGHPTVSATWSFWAGNTRGAMDRNFAHADGSVRRVDSVTWPQTGVIEETEERMVVVPMYRASTNFPPRRMQLPKR